MTNEEKAREISNICKFCLEQDTRVCDECEPRGRYDSAMEMAEWKDQQFKEYLEKKLEAVKDELSKTYIWDESCEFVRLQGQMVMLNGIINELFGGGLKDEILQKKSE